MARLGGDEFTILVNDVRSPSDPLRVAERIHRELASPVEVGCAEVFVSASIGIAVPPFLRIAVTTSSARARLAR